MANSGIARRARFEYFCLKRSLYRDIVRSGLQNTDNLLFLQKKKKIVSCLLFLSPLSVLNGFRVYVQVLGATRDPEDKFSFPSRGN